VEKRETKHRMCTKARWECTERQSLEWEVPEVACRFQIHGPHIL